MRRRPPGGSATERARERGAVLVLFALLLVGVFGLLAVTIDGARLRATRQQMLAGAEAAALEGVRWKDALGDSRRRERARIALVRQWSDELDATGHDRLALGAGTLPVVDGAAPFGGSIELAGGAAAVWRPGAALADNAENAAHGDLVAGAFVDGGDDREDDAFRRDDFVPAAVGSGAPTLAAAPALLVRLRRTPERLPTDRDPPRSSSGPPFEWLWARGAAWQEPAAGDPTDRRLSRSDGVAVRATAIGASERALLVADEPGGGVRVAPFALRLGPGATWNSTGVGQALDLQLGADGRLLGAGVEQGLVFAVPARVVGAAVTPAPGVQPPLPPTRLIVPVYAEAGGRRVVGFSFAVASATGPVWSVVRQPGGVAPASASALAPAALDARLALAADAPLRASHEAVAEPVLAPVLRR